MSEPVPPTPSPVPPGRPVCARCRRPESVCYCAHLPELPTRTRVLVLQHPREERMAIGTARMAHLSLPGSLLRVGIDFANDPVVRAATADRPSYLLFPGAGALDVHQLPVGVPATLVVLDGTWSQAGKLLRSNPLLASLPRVAFQPTRPSDYRIRRQPAPFCVSTIEALAHVLGVLEPDGGPFDRLLDPFRAMVARQEWFQTEIETGRHRLHARRPRRPPRPSLSMRLAADWPRLVCIQGEANGWPVRHPDRQESETVHFVAHRPSTGASYERVIAPRRALAPTTPIHLELPAARIRGGVTIDEWCRSWQAFVQPDDVVVQWGSYHAALAAKEGVAFPARRLDLRSELVQALGQRLGTLEACVARHGARPLPLGLDGRGGRRLAELVSLLEVLCPAGVGQEMVAPPASARSIVEP